MAAPTMFMTTITDVILSANVATLSTLMIGNTDSPMYSNVINNPERDAALSHSGGRGETPRSPKIGIANITTYVNA